MFVESGEICERNVGMGKWHIYILQKGGTPVLIKTLIIIIIIVIIVIIISIIFIFTVAEVLKIPLGPQSEEKKKVQMTCVLI